MYALLQEIFNLQQDSKFVRNFGITMLFAIAFCLTLANVQKHPTRISKQDQIAQFSNTVSAGMVIRVYETLYRY